MKKTIKSITSAVIRFFKIFLYSLVTLEPVISLSVMVSLFLLSRGLVEIGINPIVIATMLVHQILLQASIKGISVIEPIKRYVHSIGYRILTENSKEIVESLTERNLEEAKSILMNKIEVNVKAYGYSSSTITHLDGRKETLPIRSMYFTGTSYLTHNIDLINGVVVSKENSYRFIKSGSVSVVESIESDPFTESVAKELGLNDTYGTKPRFTRQALLTRHYLRELKKIVKKISDHLNSEETTTVSDKGVEKLIEVAENPESLLKMDSLVSEEALSLKSYTDKHFYAVTAFLILSISIITYTVYENFSTIKNIAFSSADAKSIVIIGGFIYILLIVALIKQLIVIIDKAKNKRLFRYIGKKYKELKKNKSTAEKI